MRGSRALFVGHFCGFMMRILTVIVQYNNKVIFNLKNRSMKLKLKWESYVIPANEDLLLIFLVIIVAGILNIIGISFILVHGKNKTYLTCLH